jgi:hypothetical protein
MAALSALRVVVPQIDIARAASGSQSAGAVGEKAFLGVRSGKQLAAAVTSERACRVAAIGNVRATAASKVVKEKAKSGEKADKSQLVSGAGNLSQTEIGFLGYVPMPLLGF